MKLKEVINRNYSQLNDSDKHILNYILNNKEDCINIAIDKLASKCNVSRTTILRFTKKLGFKGYSEFKVFLKWEIEENNEKESKPVEKFYIDLETNINNFKNKDMRRICQLIHNAERVFVYGTGTAQSVVAKEMKRAFLAIHKYFYVIEGDTELKMLTSSLKPTDTIIIISLAGEREYLVDLSLELKSMGIEYISITKLNDNKLAQNTEHSIYITTSVINLGNGNTNEAMVLFSIVSEILFREYVDYVNNLKIYKSPEIKSRFFIK